MHFLPSNSISRSRSTIFAWTQFHGKFKSLRKTSTHCCASSYRFRDINILNLLLSECRSSSRSTILQWHNSMANVKNLQMSPPSSYQFRDIKMLNLLPAEKRSRSRSTIFAMRPFDGKCQNLQTSFILFP